MSGSGSLSSWHQGPLMAATGFPRGSPQAEFGRPGHLAESQLPGAASYSHGRPVNGPTAWFPIAVVGDSVGARPIGSGGERRSRRHVAAPRYSPTHIHRHADFQYDREAGSVRVSRRPRTSFRGNDRTALPDRAYSEPQRREPTEPRPKPKNRKDVGASRPNEDRAVAAQYCRVNGGARPQDSSAYPKKQACASSATSEANSSIEFTSGLGS
jgi:hypothetical protein